MWLGSASRHGTGFLSSTSGMCGHGPTESLEGAQSTTMRILITGACGSLMREVVPRLLSRGHTVRGIDNYGRYGREAPPSDIEFLEGDLTDPTTVRRALDG